MRYPVLKAFKTFHHFYIYDRNRNSIIAVKQDEFDLLQQLESGGKDSEVIDLLQRFQAAGYLLPNSVDEVKQACNDCYGEYIDRKTEKMTLQVTQNCNLRCDYCAYNGNYINRTYSDRSMSLETAKKAIDYLFSHSCELPRVSIAFYGGEPLLRMDLIQYCVDYVASTYSEKEVYYTLTTNGTLLNDKIVDYLFSNDINIMISLDGNKEMHDRHRKFPDGSGSFDIIMKNLSRIKERYPSYYKKIMINTVLSPSNDLGCIKNFYDTDSIMDFFSPQYSLISDHNVKNPVVYGENYFVTCRTEEMKALLWIIGKIDGSFVSSLFKRQKSFYKKKSDYLTPINGLPKSCHPGGPCLAGIKRLFCDVDGNLFPCERVSEESDPMAIGTLAQGINLKKAKTLINVGSITQEACKSCWCFIHCTQCAVTADNTKELVKELRLSKCPMTRYGVLESFKDYCFLVEQGVDFSELESEENG